MTSSDVVAAPLRTDLIIGGAEVATDRTLSVCDPAEPATVVGYAAAASPEDAERAVAAAHAAFRGWSERTRQERAELVLAALGGLADSAVARAEVLTRENGKILGEAHADLMVFELRCRQAASLVSEFPPDRILPSPPLRTEIRRLPLGVVTIIVPFNWPLAILAASLPYALIAGNTAVVKPPPTAPLAVVQTLRVVAAALPPGVLNVVTGSNDDVEPLITDPRVQHVVFTGSTSGGKAVMALAARSLAGVTLELGGNDPAILLDDVDLTTDTIAGLVGATFMTTGQVCMAVKRLYVPRSRYVDVVDALSAALADQRVGGGMDPAVTMGPLHSARQHAFVSGLLDEARGAGVEVREFGAIVKDTGPGHFMLPSLVLDPGPELGIVAEEQFGPALPVIPYDEIDLLVDRLNDEWSGLCSSVWSLDLDRAGAVADRLRTGTTWVNQANATACDDRAPFGGFRQSGIGREMGPDGLLDFTQPHVVTFPAG